MTSATKRFDSIYWCGSMIEWSRIIEPYLHLPIKTSPLIACMCPTLSSMQELEVEPDVDRDRERAAALAVFRTLLLKSMSLLSGGWKLQSSFIRFRSDMLAFRYPRKCYKEVKDLQDSYEDLPRAVSLILTLHLPPDREISSPDKLSSTNYSIIWAIQLYSTSS